jgi:hypothetical protein
MAARRCTTSLGVCPLAVGVIRELIGHQPAEKRAKTVVQKAEASQLASLVVNLAYRVNLASNPFLKPTPVGLVV